MELNKANTGKITPLAIFSKLSVVGIPVSIIAYLNDKLQFFLLIGLFIYYFIFLIIFSWILIKKPSNLYAPVDFKDDEKFLTALRWGNRKKMSK